MTNFLIKYNSCVSTIARETDLEIRIAKNTQTSLRKATRVIRSIKCKSCFVYIKSLFVVAQRKHNETKDGRHVLLSDPQGMLGQAITMHDVTSPLF